MVPSRYIHLSMPLVTSGKPIIPGRPKNKETQTDKNRQDYAAHGQYLKGVAQRVSTDVKRRLKERPDGELHPIPEGTPLIVRTEPNSNLDFLRSSFDFEVVAESTDGIVLVASEDIDLTKFLEKADAFEKNQKQSGSAAKVYELVEEGEDRAVRLARILSEDLLRQWPIIDDGTEHVVDISVACNGTTKFPEKRAQEEDEDDEGFAKRVENYKIRVAALPAGTPVPKPPKRRVAETDQHYAIYMAKHEGRLRQWWEKFNALLIERETELSEWVQSYEGVVLEQHNATEFPDSFTLRARINGLGLRDIVLNHPQLFEVIEVEKVWSVTSPVSTDPASPYPTLQAPDEGAPLVMFIDSGIQEEHPLLNAAVRPDVSKSFLPGDASVSDDFLPNGHGTRVAGAALYRDGFAQGIYKSPFAIGNLRVLDAQCGVPDELSPQDYIKSVVDHSLALAPKPKIFNHSINTEEGYRQMYMSAWATAIDLASYKHDIIFVQSAGNLVLNDPNLADRDVNYHLSRRRKYPEYLLRQECRLGSPAQSFQALTVGSISPGDWVYGDHRNMAPHLCPSPFTTSGHGIWDSVKPDVVEVGGDYAIDSGSAPRAKPHLQSSVELIRTTFQPGRLTQQDGFGTSFAAPRVTGMLAEIQKQLPGEPALLYRALVATSARWPAWAEKEDQNKSDVLRLIGFGLPDEERALYSSDSRVTLITQGFKEIGGTEAHVYRVPIPDELRAPSDNSRIRIDVALSYAALPKRTRRNPRGYLSTWADWKSSCKSESYESFAARVIEELSGTAARDSSDQINWMLREQDQWGVIQGVNRSVGTLQKDWAILQAHEFPQDFCISVQGHKGWDLNSDEKAKYSLAITIESLGAELELYTPIRTALEALIEVPATEIKVSS